MIIASCNSQWVRGEETRSKYACSSRIKGGVSGSNADGAPNARVHGVRLSSNVTDVEPITLEEYRRRNAAEGSAPCP